MSSRRSLFAFTCVAFAIAGCKKSGGGADDPTEYTITVKQPTAGMSVRGEMKIDMEMKLDVRDKNGKPDPRAAKEMPGNIKEEVGYSETVLEMPPGAKRPTRTAMLIDKWEKGKDTLSKREVMDRIVGREVLIEKRYDRYEFRAADGGPLDHNVTIFLDKRYNDLFEAFNIQDFLPGKPTKRYVDWEIPIRKMTRLMGNAAMFPFDEEKSKGTGRLTSVYDKDGHKYGRIELRASFVPTMKEKDITVNEAKIELNVTIELCIDGSRHDVQSTVKGEVVFDATHRQEGSAKISAKINMSMNEAETADGPKGGPARKASKYDPAFEPEVAVPGTFPEPRRDEFQVPPGPLEVEGPIGAPPPGIKGESKTLPIKKPIGP